MMKRLMMTGLTAAIVVAPVSAQEETTVQKLIDFNDEQETSWFVVNDGVMGGRSSSTIRRGEAGTAVFEGDLSLENNGGFASVRAEVTGNAMAGAETVLLRVRGDGKRYQLRLRPGRRFDGVAYGGSFETVADEWVVVEFPIDSFQPTFRGYRPRNTGPLDPATVEQIGLMLTDKQVGSFRLEVDWIGFAPAG
jgi:NADH dehydrogenase [ubiquinone] 1 alpha subcomplex assembly factor 1